MLNPSRRCLALRFSVGAWLAILATWCCADAPLARAQAVQPQERYDTIRPRLSSREANRLKPSVGQALRNPVGFGADQQAVEDYFKKYYFPMMTLYDSENLADLAKMRERYFKSFVDGAANPSSRQYLVDLALNVSKVLTRKHFHPAVRYNAVLMLGQLDAQAPTNTKPPVPLPAATPELLELVDQAQFDGEPVPESVKLGALIGLERHTRYGIDAQYAERLTKSMLAVVANRESPEDVDQDVHDWVCTLAAQTLINQYAKNPTAEVQAALTKLIADENMELDDRCTVVRTLSKMAYPAGGQIIGPPEVTALGQLTLDVVSKGAKLAREYQKEVLGGGFIAAPRRSQGGYGGYGGEYGGGFGGRGGARGEQGPQFDRRQIMARLTSIVKGGKSLSAGLADADVQHVAALLAEIEPAMDVIEDKDSVEVDVTRAVIDLEASVKQLVGSWQQQPADGDAAAEDIGG